MAFSDLLKKKNTDADASGGNSTQSPSGFGLSTTTAIMEGEGAAAGASSPKDGAALYLSDSFRMPVLGQGTAERHQRVLFVLLGLCVAVLAGMVAWTVLSTDKVAKQVSATGNALMQSQRLAKSVSQAAVGNASAFAEVKESADELNASVAGLQKGSETVPRLGAGYAESMSQIVPLVERAHKNTQIVLGQEKTLTQVGVSLRKMSSNSTELLSIAENISSLKLQANAPAAEMSATGQLVMLTQRISKSANESLTLDGINPEAVFLLGKDLNTFKEIAEGLLNGNADLRLAPARDDRVRENLQSLLKVYEQTRADASGILGNLQGLVAAREAQNSIVADSEPCCCMKAASASRALKSSVIWPNSSSRNPSASMTPTRRPSCG